MKYVLSLSFSLSIAVSLAAAPSRLDQLEEKVERMSASETEMLQSVTRIQGQQDLLEKRVGNLVEVIDVSNDGISNALNASNSYLTVVSIIIALLATGLAFYVTFLERKMKSMKDAMSQMNQDVSTKETEVKALVNQINSDVGGLFVKIRREDTKSMLKRLVKVPEDVTNMEVALLSRDLEKEDFLLLKQAYMALVEKGRDKDRVGIFKPTKGEEYLLLFFQHFSGLSVEDSIIGERIIPYFQRGLDCAFENDVIKVIDDLSEVLVKKNSSFDRVNVLAHFITALNHSKETKDHPEYLQLLKEKINDSQLWQEAEEKATGIKEEDESE